MPELLQSVYTSQHIFSFLVLNARSLVPFNMLLLTSMGNCWNSDKLSPSLIIVYMKKQVAVVTAKTVVN